MTSKTRENVWCLLRVEVSPVERLETLQSGKISCIFLDDVSPGDQSHSSGSITVDRSNCARASTRFRCKSQQTNSIRRRCEIHEPRRRNSARCPSKITAAFPLHLTLDEKWNLPRWRVFIPRVCVVLPWRNVLQILAQKSVPFDLALWILAIRTWPPESSLPPVFPLVCSWSDCRHPNWLDTSDEREAST